MPTKKTSNTSKTSSTSKPRAKAAAGKGVDKKDAPKLSLKEHIRMLYGGESLRFIIGLLLLVVAFFMLLSFGSHFFTGHAEQSAMEAGSAVTAANYGGVLGAYTAHFFMDECFGVGAFFVPLFIILLSVKLMRVYKVRLWKYFIHFTLLMVWLSVTLALLQHSFDLGSGLSFKLGGMHGFNVSQQMMQGIGTLPAYVAIVVCALLYLIYLSKKTIEVLRKLMKPQELVQGRLPGWPFHRKKTEAEEETDENDEAIYTIEGGVVDEDTTDAEHKDDTNTEGYTEDYTVSLDFSTNTETEEAPQMDLVPNAGETTTTFSVETGTAEEAAAGTPAAGTEQNAPVNPEDLPPYDPCLDLENYTKPDVALLKQYDDASPSIDMAEQNANKDRIITVLGNFGVQLTSIKATIGPTITLYEITLAPGVKISKVRGLEDDIALSLSALGIRIIAPIPGKGTVGIEVPNKKPRIVSMESIINTKKFQESTFELPIALGKTITNEVFMVDLAKMPHLLVAGATGQGKSVGLNAIITSLLYKKHPAELKLVMVDPKKVEFSVYSPIEKHFLAKIEGEDDPIITDVTKVVQTLKSLCAMMDHRYDLLKKAKVRNIKEYNTKFKQRVLSPLDGHEFMPYIVVIIDEFGDLIMTAGKEVELPIARIAQLARAVGMHMIIATQRPTTNIITGTIKANFPARMAFKVMSRIDSQTILDRTGANQLVGKGDMLFLAGNDPVRVQCAFVDTPEVESICTEISRQQAYPTAFILPEVADDAGASGKGAGAAEPETIDPMFEEAARLIVVHQSGSTSLIQRKFSIGYNRAGRLMDQMERAGIVGPTRGAKPREVYVADENALDSILAGLGDRL